ncbi:MAG: Ldh family oxidoreductase, partial [Planctomycetes bacterium]|nr:Ldh family oxidoreductase [Planctomycetota bacterium]
MLTLPAEELKNYCTELFKTKGVPPDEAFQVADNLVDADLKGVESHGTMRVANYLQRLAAGIVRPKAERRIVSEFPGTAVVDGLNSLGAVTGSQVMKMAVEKARNTGVSFITVYNSNHYSAAAYFAQIALEHDMIGFTATNSPPRVAPSGGKAPVLGTNPFAFAIPAGKRLPILADMATC